MDDNVDVLVYAGDVDYICNWLGNKAWVLDLQWQGKEGMNAAKDDDYLVADKTAGRLRSHKTFHFLQIYQAGHMVPMDKPEVGAENDGTRNSKHDVSSETLSRHCSDASQT